MGLKTAIFFGVWIFLFTLYDYELINLPDPSFDALTVHRGKIVSANHAEAAQISRRVRRPCRLWVELDSDPSAPLGLPCSGDFMEMLSLIGEDAEIRTWNTVVWGVFEEQEVWDVVVSGKHYYDYNYKYDFRQANSSRTRTFVFWSHVFIWLFYIAIVIWVRRINIRKMQQDSS